MPGAISSTDRLTALRLSGFIEAPPQPTLESLAELALDLVGGTCALISAIDDRHQHYKAIAGHREPWRTLMQVPVAESLCQEVVRSGVPHVVPDTSELGAASGAKAHGVGAYLGVPLTDAAGHVLGTVCVLDVKPRAWRDVDVLRLERLAAAVMSEVSLRQALVRERSVALEQARLDALASEAKRVASERSAVEQQLIGIVSHDLRNPLQTILFSVGSLIRNGGLDERATRNVLRVNAAAERASRLVLDLLDFTQARLGRGIPIYPRAVDLAELVDGWVDESRASHLERDVQLVLEGDLNAMVDPDRMAQVVGNLVSNAVKYSPSGSTVRVTARGEPASVVLSVHNEGPPIPEAQRSRLFQPLERGDGERDMASRSVGLGLFIVKHVVAAHHGTIEVTSSQKAGTTFVVRLPR